MSINFRICLSIVGATLFAMMLSTAAIAEIKTVVTEGSSDTCFERELALKLAAGTAKNHAYEECSALGNGWQFKGNKFPGYTQCVQCGPSQGFKCKVTQAVFNCESMAKENAENAAKARAAKEAADAEAKRKADIEIAAREMKKKQDEAIAADLRAKKAVAEKQAKEKAEQAQMAALKKKEEAQAAAAKAQEKDSAQHNSIDDAFATLEKSNGGVKRKNATGSEQGGSIDAAFSSMDKQTGRTPANKVGDINSQFEGVQAYRVEQERQRVAEIERKRKAEADRIASIARNLRFTSHHNGDRATSRVVAISGDTQGYGPNETLAVHFNGASQQVSTNSKGEFATKIILTSGNNDVKVCHAEKCQSLALFADVEKLALMATLTWGGKGDLDLHVMSPSGECSYQSKRLSGVCNLDIDDTQGNNPENMSIPLTAPNGNYRFWVVNYNGVQGVDGTLKLYQNEKLVDTKRFVASGSRGTEVSVELVNYR